MKFNSSNISARRFYIGFMILWVISSIPIFVSSQPPLADYPNHLARVHILLNPDDTNLHQFYEILYAIRPNLAFDIVVYYLAQIFGLDLAGKLFVVATIGVSVLGPALLYVASTGRYSVWPWVGFLFAYNRLFAWGFLGYLFSLGIAFGVVALWAFTRKKRPLLLTFFVRSLAATMVLIGHLYAFGMLGLIIVLMAFCHFAEEIRSLPWRDVVQIAIWELSPLLVPIVIFFLLSPLSQQQGDIVFGPFLRKIVSLTSPMVGQLVLSDLVGLFVVGAVFLFLLLKGKIKFHCYALPLLFVMAVVHLLMPDKFFSSYGADKRMPIGMAFAFVALADLKVSRKTYIRVFSIFFIVFIVRVSAISMHWRSFAPIHEEFGKAISLIDKGSRIIYLVGTETPYELPLYPLTEHAGWAVIQKNVFWPGLFANPIHNGQSVAFRKPYDGMFLTANLQKIHLDALSDFLKEKTVQGDFFVKRVLPCYDYVLLGAEKPGFIPKDLNWNMAYSGRHFALYRVGARIEESQLNAYCNFFREKIIFNEF